MIVFVHLLNDSSGSPKVLSTVIAALKTNKNLRLFVGSGSEGWLDSANIRTTKYWYRHTPYRALTFFTYIASQLHLFLKLAWCKEIDKNAIIYVNTLLPIGAALYGKLTKRVVVYHLHEVSISPSPFKWLLTKIARHTATKLIYVSEYHRECLPIYSVPAITIHNVLDEAFVAKATVSYYRHRFDGNFNVLMLASLRDYKGVPEFIQLAAQLLSRTDIRFHLVANDDQVDIDRYFKKIDVPSNVTVYPRTNSPAAYYANASLVLNLSRPDLWIETFGLTLLEAMAFGLPVIAPPVGGPVEVISDGVTGFFIDSRDSNALLVKVRQLADNEALCLELSKAARHRSVENSAESFSHALKKVLSIN